MARKNPEHDQIVPDRRIEAALDGKRDEATELIRELINEAYNRGLSAGRMKSAIEHKRGTW